MGVEIDRLEIDIESKATKVNNSLDTLVTKLDRVSGALSHLNSSGLVGLSNGVAKFAQASAQLSSIDSRKFKTMAENIEKLSTFNTQQIYNAASAMKTLSTAINSLGGVSTSGTQVAEIANSISKLGGANVQKAIANLPALAVAMNNFMAIMAKAPQINKNIIDMTNALANLASQGAKVGTAGNSIIKSINRVGTSTKTAAKKIRSFSSVLGSLYQQFFWVSRGIDKLWDSVENSMGYVETLNYFDAAFGQVADDAINDWEQMGYDSADAYYNSFSRRAKELTSRMTGFSINADGTLTATGTESLGIAPSKLMNYQATFAQMSSSMGVASETSLKLSQALTEIGADLASVKNMDFDKVWNDMASGLAGMSRTLDKYGANIRNVNLQQKLTEIGIEANITALNQNDKALLRTIILLDSTRYAWGDLADTVDQPANQLRLIESNFNNLSRTIGNLFLPVIQKVLPYVNALLISLQRLFAWVGSLFGLDLSKITESVGSSEFDMSDFADSAEEAAGALDSAAGSAEKLNRQTRKWDEVNNLSSPSESGSAGVSFGNIESGLLDAALDNILSEYQIAWDEAFANMENRAQEMADRIEKNLLPIKNIIEDFKIGDFFEAGVETGKLANDIFQQISDSISNVKWGKIGDNVAKFLNGMFKNIKGKNIAKGVNALVNAIWDLFSHSLKNFNYGNLVRIFGEVIANLDWETIAKLGISVGGVKLAKWLISSFIANFKNGFTESLGKMFKSPEVTRTITSGASTIGTKMSKIFVGVAAVVGEYAFVKDAVHDLFTETGSVLANLSEIVASAGIASAALYVAFGPAGLAVAGVTALVGAIGGINQALDEAVDESIGNTIRDALTVPGGVPLDEITENFASYMSNIGESFSVIAEKSAGMKEADTNIKNTVTEIEKIKTAMDNGVLSVEEGKEKLATLFEDLSIIATDKFGNISALIVGAFGENGAVSEAFEKAGGNATELVSVAIGLESEATARLAELRTLMSDLSPQDPEYNAYYEEYLRIIGVADDATVAVDNFKLSLESIDLSSILTNENKLDTSALENCLSTISMSYADTENIVTDSVSGINTSLSELLKAARELGDSETENLIEESIGKMPTVLSGVRGELSTEALLFSDTVQTELINKISDVIEEANEEYENLDPLEKFAAGSQEEYISAAITRYQDNVIIPLSNEIEAKYSEMGIVGAGWAAKASEDIIDGLYDPANFQNKDRTENIFAIAEDYENVIKKGLEEANPKIKTHAEKTGNYLYEGLQSGLSYKFDKTKTLMENYANNQISNPFASKLKIHSPSKVFEDYGMYIVQGLNKGVEQNQLKTIQEFGDFATDIASTFDGLSSTFTSIGVNAMSGLLNGLSDMTSSVLEKAKSIADGIKGKIQTALDIHSPSRVMFALGEYTMEGLQLGMESLYSSIETSVGEFSKGLQIAPAPAEESLYGNYRVAYAGMPNYTTNSFVENTYTSDSRENNALLRMQIELTTRQNQILMDILQKEGITERDIYEANRKYTLQKDKQLKKRI